MDFRTSLFVASWVPALAFSYVWIHAQAQDRSAILGYISKHDCDPQRLSGIFQARKRCALMSVGGAQCWQFRRASRVARAREPAGERLEENQ